MNGTFYEIVKLPKLETILAGMVKEELPTFNITIEDLDGKERTVKVYIDAAERIVNEPAHLRTLRLDGFFPDEKVKSPECFTIFLPISEKEIKLFKTCRGTERILLLQFPALFTNSPIEWKEKKSSKRSKKC